MTDNFAVFPLFSIPIYASFIDVLDSEIDHICSIPYMHMGDNLGYISHNKFLLDDNNLILLKNKIQKHIEFFLKKNLQFDESYKLEIKKSWGIKHVNGDYSPKHDHVNSLFSGVLYLKCDEISGDIVFYKEPNYCNLMPPLLVPNFKDYNMINSFEWKFTPKKYQIFLFPSHLAHSVTESKSLNERISMAFNIWVHGDYGSDDQKDSQGYINL